MDEREQTERLLSSVGREMFMQYYGDFKREADQEALIKRLLKENARGDTPEPDGLNDRKQKNYG